MIIETLRSGESGFSHADLADLDAIFFASSSTQSFPDAASRQAFRYRWLDSYLTENKNEIFVSRASDGRIAGYLVGALDDPAQSPRHAELDYFQYFALWTRLYPAHLHINVAPQHRSAGIGARLIETFARHAAALGAPGMHVVTGKGLRNVGFYLRNGFAQVAEAPWKTATVVMLARRLQPC